MRKIYDGFYDRPNEIWDKEIDIIISSLYNNKKYISLSIEEILLKNNINFDEKELRLLKGDLELSRCAIEVNPYSPLKNEDYPKKYEISDIGVEVIKAYGSYLSFIRKERRNEKKEDRKKDFSQRLKNTQILFGIVSVFITSVLLIIQSFSKSSIVEQEKDIEYLKNRVDSLQNTIQKIQSIQ